VTEEADFQITRPTSRVGRSVEPPVDRPLVSIGMPTFNGGAFVREALESLLRQTYADLEIIISDDGSTDATLEICRDVARGDTRVALHEGPHRGEMHNFNAVLRMARGKYFMWAADHDRWDSRYVAECVRALDADPHSILVHAKSALIDGEGRELDGMDDDLAIRQERSLDRYRALIWRLENCNAIYGVIRRESLARTGGYGPYPSPDHLVLAKLALEGTFIQLPGVMYFRRQNRPAETPEEQRIRQRIDLNPALAHEWKAVPRSRYYKSLRDAHLRAVWSAPMPIGHKFIGSVATIACFAQRFGVASRVWTLARILSKALPQSFQRRTMNVVGGR